MSGNCTLPKAAPDPDFQVVCLRTDDGHTSSTWKSRRYQKRKAHSKSKGGCLGCKLKRVKCDERAPICSRCQRNSTPCAYPLKEGIYIGPSEGEHDRPKADPSLSFAQQMPLRLDALDCDQSWPAFGTSRLALLHHFRQAYVDILGGPVTDGVVTLALSRTFLLDAILAVSASHLCYYTSSNKPHRIAEHVQQVLALRNFQTALNEPMDVQTADALILTCVLLNMLSWSFVEDEDPLMSWVFSNAEDRLGWFSIQLGLKPLLMATRAFREASILQWMYRASDDEKHTYTTDGLPLDNVPEPWLALCGLGTDPSVDSIFYEPVRVLASIKDVEPRFENVFIYTQFAGKLDKGFCQLLESRDERALWLMGYWFGLLYRFDQRRNHWWQRKRVRRDYQAIRLYLKGGKLTDRVGHEGLMWKQLMVDLEAAPYWNGPELSASGARLIGRTVQIS